MILWPWEALPLAIHKLFNCGNPGPIPEADSLPASLVYQLNRWITIGLWLGSYIAMPYLVSIDFPHPVLDDPFVWTVLIVLYITIQLAIAGAIVRRLVKRDDYAMIGIRVFLYLVGGAASSIVLYITATHMVRNTSNRVGYLGLWAFVLWYSILNAFSSSLSFHKLLEKKRAAKASLSFFESTAILLSQLKVTVILVFCLPLSVFLILYSFESV